jgi:hypothetical protein
MCDITVVCGSPGSGKTMYVKKHMCKGDLIVDLDMIYAAISGSDSRDRDKELLPYMFAVRDALYNKLDSWTTLQRAWIIACLPKAYDRESISRRFNAKVILINKTKRECMQQSISDTTRMNDMSFNLKLITEWFDAYTPRQKDVLVIQV